MFTLSQEPGDRNREVETGSEKILKWKNQQF